MSRVFSRGHTQKIFRRSDAGLNSRRLFESSLAGIEPVQELTEGCAAVAVARFLDSRQFRQRFPDLRKIKQGIVSKAVVAAGSIQNCSFNDTVERIERSAIPGDSQHADKSRGALLRRNALELAQHAGVVGFILDAAI